MISEFFTFQNSCIIKFEAKCGVQILNFILYAKARPYFKDVKPKISSRTLNFWNVSTQKLFILRKILTI